MRSHINHLTRDAGCMLGEVRIQPHEHGIPRLYVLKMIQCLRLFMCIMLKNTNFLLQSLEHIRKRRSSSRPLSSFSLYIPNNGCALGYLYLVMNTIVPSSTAPPTRSSSLDAHLSSFPTLFGVASILVLSLRCATLNIRGAYICNVYIYEA